MFNPEIMSRKMHIVLAFILSIFSAVLVVLNYNQYIELAVIESRKDVAVHAAYPHYKRISGPVQVADNPIYKEIKPFRSTARNVVQGTQQPGVLSGNFSAASIARQTSNISSFQNFNLPAQNFNSRRDDRNVGNPFVGQYSPGGVSVASVNGNFGNNLSGFRSGSNIQRNQDRPQSELIARGQSSFDNSMFGSTEAGPSFAKSDLMSTPLGIDPGGDPDDPLGPPTPMIPVPDGLVFLLLIAAFYSILLFLRKK
jgi:hypothetical protein